MTRVKLATNACSAWNHFFFLFLFIFFFLTIHIFLFIKFYFNFSFYFFYTFLVGCHKIYVYWEAFNRDILYQSTTDCLASSGRSDVIASRIWYCNFARSEIYVNKDIPIRWGGSRAILIRAHEQDGWKKDNNKNWWKNHPRKIS